MNIAVVGTGYVGLVTGVGLAETGHNVICVDIDAEKVGRLSLGQVPIYEQNLDLYLERNIKANRISFTTDLRQAVDNADILFFALPTPDGGDGAADLSYVLNAAEAVAALIKDYKIIVNKSTVPVGTAEKVRAVISAKTNIEFDVVSNPEFLREGFAMEDFMKPDRIVIGTSSAKAKELMADLYKSFERQGCPILFMDERSAELTKYAANSFLAMKITFMNEIANLCERTGADVDMVRQGMGTDERIGKRFLFPGIGYGGSCFPKDVKALAKSAEEYGYDFSILNSVSAVNDKQKIALVTKLKEHFNNNISGKKIAVWGLAFKPETDDMREAPSIYTINALLVEGCTVAAYDAEATGNAKRIFGDKVEFVEDKYAALKDADAVFICTEWNEFSTPDFEKMNGLLKNKLIFDGRNIFGLDEMAETGYTYYSIGRKAIKA